jgi:pimeloyl-ACP methyl ester carboxylesterase
MDWIAVQDTSLRYEVRGTGAATLVLLHEMGGTLESWDLVVEPLAHSRRVVRYDMRGAGLSEKVRGRLSMATLANDLGGLLDALKITSPVVLAGCAVGGAVGLYFAAHHPERVTAVIATSPATGLRPEQKATMLQGADNLEREGAGVLLARLGQSYPEVVRKNAAHFETFRNRYRCNDPESLAATFRMLTDLEMTRELESIKCPVLVLAGEHDLVRPPPVVESIAARIPGAQLRTVASGHFMAFQTPNIFLSEVEAFLAEIGV